MGRLSFKWGDLLAILLVLAAAVLTWTLLPALTSNSAEFAVIYQDGRQLRQVPLDVDQVFQINGEFCNTVTVRNGRIAVTESNCPTNDCVHQGWKSNGGSIICLPNGVEIRLVDDGDVDHVIR